MSEEIKREYDDNLLRLRMQTFNLCCNILIDYQDKVNNGFTDYKSVAINIDDLYIRQSKDIDSLTREYINKTKEIK